jgi:hypothetical protein
MYAARAVECKRGGEIFKKLRPGQSPQAVD